MGAEFETIQNNYRIGNLPSTWTTQDWPTILVLCRDFYNSVKPMGPSRRENITDNGIGDLVAHKKKIREWFMNPTKFQNDIDYIHRLHPDKCIFHLTKSHPTCDCHVKKEYDKFLSNKKSSSTSSGTDSTDNLRQIMEDVYEDALADDALEVSHEDNDTNEDSLIYFFRLTNHYLRLVKSDARVSRHDMKYPIIADSGANFHMFCDKEFFQFITPACGKVILGDGKKTLDVKGVGTISCSIGGHMLTIPNVRYIPDLAESIYSLFLHIQNPDHGLESSFETGLHLIFPGFKTKALLGVNDIYLDAHLTSTSSETCAFFEGPACPTPDAFCSHLTTFQSALDHETNILDNIILHLQEYYKTIETKRQLDLEVPAGFRRDTNHQKLYNNYLRSVISSQLDDRPSIESPVVEDSTLIDHPVDTNSSSFDINCPIVRAVDKASSSLPNVISMSEDYLRSCTGFRRLDTFKQQFHHLYQSTVKLDHTPADAILDSGHFANMKKKNRNTSPIPRSSYFGETIHVDIVFGPEVSVGNVKL